jgi:hypothetical protein
MDTLQIDDETTMFIVISDMDGVSDLFFERHRAGQYAQVAGGTVYRLLEDDEEGVS